ncbi:MAG: C4-dicarboxylate ABC transporter substrate-binding protein, partial [Deltaproteobacteria bacterium]|nr:C4-dicarboxylate ABC transporter substrate-binding protein [Deltaproteobacteria bacterium]
MKRMASVGLTILLVLWVSTAFAQKQVRLSIATGGTGGVYYPIGGGMANILSK